MSCTRITWHGYRYFPYERELARREAERLLGTTNLIEHREGFEVPDDVCQQSVRRLTYFSELRNGRAILETTQRKLEAQGERVRNRQSTRYSAHGLHEYKGKFNPQIAKALMNMLGVGTGANVLDPFCGSGTTLVEAVQLGANASGSDLNPFAVFLANAKLNALSCKRGELVRRFDALEKALRRPNSRRGGSEAKTSRGLYLAKWFDSTQLRAIEKVRTAILERCASVSDVFLAIASDLLRDYSLQDPNDLRIRRRSSPLPAQPFEPAFLERCAETIQRIESARSVLGPLHAAGGAKCVSAIELQPDTFSLKFDCAITSPPYAMALPYIDTQRLSLIWLGLISADEILRLEALLIGSREFRGAKKRQLEEALTVNDQGIPADQHRFCCKLAAEIAPTDGFRRRAVPILLYRYFVAMRDSFRAVRRVVKSRGPFALVVGHNHTVLGGHRYDIDTPSHLASIAASVGWNVDEFVTLQTYQRFGYHMANSVEAETLVLLRNK